MKSLKSFVINQPKKNPCCVLRCESITSISTTELSIPWDGVEVETVPGMSNLTAQRVYIRRPGAYKLGFRIYTNVATSSATMTANIYHFNRVNTFSTTTLSITAGDHPVPAGNIHFDKAGILYECATGDSFAITVVAGANGAGAWGEATNEPLRGIFSVVKIG